MPKSRTSGSLGDFGLSARWSPQWLDGTVGAYVRNTTDILPQLMLTPGVAALPAATCTAIGGTALTPTTCLANPKATTVADLQKYGKAGTYQTAYGNNIQLYGLSLSKNVAGVSVGSELSYRRNMPLVSDAVSVVPALAVPLVAMRPAFAWVPPSDATTTRSPISIGSAHSIRSSPICLTPTESFGSLALVVTPIRLLNDPG